MTQQNWRSREMPEDDEINLRELFRIFWGRRLSVALVALICGCAALAAALLIPKKYTASMVLSPVGSSMDRFGGEAAGGSSASEYAGLASLVGINIPGNDQKEEAIALLKSNVITREFIQRQNLLPVLYSSRWDAARGRWRNGVHVPTLWEGSRYFEKKIEKVEEDTKTELVTLSIEWKDPRQAADWANELVATTNAYSRQKAINEAERDIAFLNVQAAKTQYVEEREGIFSILETELTKEMLAKGSDEYSIKVVDPAFAPEKPSFPLPVLWTAGGLFLGVVLGCGYALYRSRPVLETDTPRSGTPRAFGKDGPAESAYPASGGGSA
jgi:uncharacterized protein involved in exopolysaccharide biosynthesis